MDEKILTPTPEQEIATLESSVFEADTVVDAPPVTENVTPEEDTEMEAPSEYEDVEETEEETTEDAEETEESDTSEEKAPLFTKEQQSEVNKLVKARLERAEQKMLKDLTTTAGTQIEQRELAPAARLWGLLKSNPVLSGKIDQLIADAIQRGEAKPPQLEDMSANAVTERLAFKEAVLDLRQADAQFNKNATKVLAWAEKEGYSVKDAKSLKMAYLAWKGSQGAVASVAQKSIAQQKQNAKQVAQKKAASVQVPKKGNAPSKMTDYRKMTDAQILAAQGLKLFVEE